MPAAWVTPILSQPVTRIAAHARQPRSSKRCRPLTAQLEALLGKIINRIIKVLTRAEHLIEEEGVAYLANTDSENVLAPLHAAAATWRIAQGPRARQKVLRMQRGHSLPFTRSSVSIVCA